MAHRTSEYSHRLTPNVNYELERRVELEATEVVLLRKRLEDLQASPNQNARSIERAKRKYESRRDSLGEKCMSLFSVVGSGLVDGAGKAYGYDEALLFAVAKALAIFDPGKGKFAHLVRRMTVTTRNEFAKAEDRYQSRVAPISDDDRGIVSMAESPQFSWGQFVESQEEDPQAVSAENDASSDEADGVANANAGLEVNSLPIEKIKVEGGFGDADALAAEIEESRRANAAFVQFLSLIIGFLEHKEDKRDYTTDKKLYTRLFFTESVTRIVKECPVIEECEVFEPHEREVIGAVELPFQDVYLVDQCRSIRAIWWSNLKEGFGEIIPYGDPRREERNPWHLNADVYRDYFENVTGKSVSRVAITNQRNNYKKLCESLLTIEY